MSFFVSVCVRASVAFVRRREGRGRSKAHELPLSALSAGCPTRHVTRGTAPYSYCILLRVRLCCALACSFQLSVCAWEQWPRLRCLCPLACRSRSLGRAAKENGESKRAVTQEIMQQIERKFN
jgi:hypothetical protein